jgi:thiol-disulfide isomerase/thioredoxin
MKLHYLLLGALLVAAASADEWERVDAKAAPFTLKDLEGRALNSAELAGKIVVVDFWATWCSPCIRELPELARYYASVKDRKDVAFLSFSVTEDAETVSKFVKTRKVPYPVYLADDLVGPYEVSIFPTKLIFDMRKGSRLRFRNSGYTTIAELEARVAELLAAPTKAD